MKEEELVKMASIINLNRCSSFQVAVALADAGYRPVEQIRKETAKELLDEVSKHYGGAWLVELYKKYGVM